MMFSELLNKLPKHLADELNTVTIQSGDIITNQEAPPFFVFIVLRGTVKAFHTNERGQEFLIGIFGNNELFGELEYFTKTNYFGTVEALTECEIVKIPHAVFEKILEHDFKMSVELCQALSNRLLKLSDRTVQSSYYPLEFLIAKFLVNESNDISSDTIIISRENMSSYFGTNIRSINRILKKFADEKLITTRKNDIVIESLDGLKRIYKQY
ncbi:MAG: Crp/Fnr family transcriptional regulator [Bacteroidetes bacterium]|nr:Crp/Fnr family transcriptional regulator [Bacteroidota bacterium]